jgi:hypothetical protein
MAWRLSYSFMVEHCDNNGNPDGQAFPFQGSQLIPAANPQSGDLSAAATAAGADIAVQLAPLANTLNLPNPSD